MKIVNNSQRLVSLSFRDGRTINVPESGSVTLPDSDFTYLDDTAATLALFSAGVLTLQATDGGTWAGTPLPATPNQQLPFTRSDVFTGRDNRLRRVDTGARVPVGGLELQTRRRVAQAAARLAAPNQAAARANNEQVYATDVRALPTGELIVAAGDGLLGAAAPTITAGATPAAITDGAVQVWPLQARTRAPLPGIPPVTIADNAGASALTQVNMIENPEKFEQLSAPNLYRVTSSGNASRHGAWLMSDGSTGTSFGGTNGRMGKYRTSVFVTESDVVHIGYFATISAGMPGERLRVWVDDVPVSEAPLVPGAFGSTRHFSFTVAGGRRRRVWRVAAAGLFNLSNVAVPADCSVSRPTVKSLSLLELGDSILDTEMPSLNTVHYELGNLLGLELGFAHVAVGGVGGVSYALDSATGGRKAMRTLMASNDFTGVQADAAVLALGYNAGGGGVTPAAEAAAALEVWAAVRGILSNPTAPIAVIGPWYASAAQTAAMTAVRDALKAAFLSWDDLNSAFIDPLDGSITLGDGTVVRSATQAWLPANVAAWALPAAGGVFDGAHPSIAGKFLLKDLSVDAVDAAFTALAA